MVDCKINLLEGPKANQFNCLCTIFLWATIYILASTCSKFKLVDLDVDVMIHDWTFYVDCGMYLIYLILQFSTTGFRKFIKTGNIRDILKINIENKFSIKFHGQAWYIMKEANNKSRKMITYDKKIIYHFKTGSDFSNIIINSESVKNKKYLDLEIEYEYICLDNETKKEHDIKYEEFYNETRIKDNFFSVKKLVEIPNAHSKNIISLQNPCLTILDKIIFIIAIFLTLGQIYKYFISQHIYESHIKITKIISNYYDLTEADFFYNIQPLVKLNQGTLNYQRNLFAFKNPDYLENIFSNNKKPFSNEFKEYVSQNKDFIKDSNEILALEGNDENLIDDNNNNKLELVELI